MGFLKSLVAFGAGVALLLALYTWVSIPVLPCMSAYVVGLWLLEQGQVWVRRFFLVVFGLLAVWFYGLNLWWMILMYPAMGNVLGIVAEGATLLAYVGAVGFLVVSLGREYN